MPYVALESVVVGVLASESVPPELGTGFFPARLAAGVSVPSFELRGHYA